MQVHYLAVAREKDETIIASKVSQCFDDEKEKAEAFKTDIKVVLRAPDYNFNTTLDSLYRISQDSSCNFIRRANGSAFFAITANEYPEDKCKLLLDDVVDAFQVNYVCSQRKCSMCFDAGMCRIMVYNCILLYSLK